MHNLIQFCIFVPGINAWISVVRLSESVNETTDLILQQTNLNQIQSYKIASLTLSLSLSLSLALQLSIRLHHGSARKQKRFTPFSPLLFAFQLLFLWHSITTDSFRSFSRLNSVQLPSVGIKSLGGDPTASRGRY